MLKEKVDFLLNIKDNKTFINFLKKNNNILEEILNEISINEKMYILITERCLYDKTVKEVCNQLYLSEAQQNLLLKKTIEKIKNYLEYHYKKNNI